MGGHWSRMSLMTGVTSAGCHVQLFTLGGGQLSPSVGVIQKLTDVYSSFVCWYCGLIPARLYSFMY